MTLTNLDLCVLQRHAVAAAQLCAIKVHVVVCWYQGHVEGPSGAVDSGLMVQVAEAVGCALQVVNSACVGRREARDAVGAALLFVVTPVDGVLARVLGVHPVHCWAQRLHLS